jgi:hypothetical protein
MSVAAEDDYADSTFCTDIPHCLKDLLALGKIPCPRIFKAKLPVLSKWDTRGYNFPAHSMWNRFLDPSEEVMKLGFAEHSL